jgi:hypothetical protein
LRGDKKEFRIDAPISHGQDELQKYMSAPEVFSLAAMSPIIMTPKHATVLSRTTGLFWVFSLEKASLVKAGNIFNKVTPEMIAKGGFPNPILCVNPEKDGTILIGAQDESFFTTESGDLIKEINEMESKSNLSDEEATMFLVRRMRELAEKNPYIVWYRIHPENGRVEKLDNPPEGGSNVREGGKNDYWRPMPDGSVKIGVLEREIGRAMAVEARKAAENKAEEDAKKEGQAGAEPAKTANANTAAKTSADAKKNDLAAK